MRTCIWLLSMPLLASFAGAQSAPASTVTCPAVGMGAVQLPPLPAGYPSVPFGDGWSLEVRDSRPRYAGHFMRASFGQSNDTNVPDYITCTYGLGFAVELSPAQVGALGAGALGAGIGIVDGGGAVFELRRSLPKGSCTRPNWDEFVGSNIVMTKDLAKAQLSCK